MFCLATYRKHIVLLCKNCVFEGCLWPLAASGAAESRGESAESPRRVWGETAGRHWPRLGLFVVVSRSLWESVGVQMAPFKQVFQDDLDKNSQVQLLMIAVLTTF